MAKVGSSSVSLALRNSKDTAPMSGHWIYDKTGEFFTSGKAEIMDRIVEAGTPLKIITLVRDPMARNRSAFFQSLHKYAPDWRDKSIKELQEIFVNRYDITWGDQWFEREVPLTFGRNVLGEPFTGNGHQIYRGVRGELLVLRLEDANAVFEEAMEKLLGFENMVYPVENVMSNVPEKGKVYDEFKKLKYPEAYVRKVMGVQFARTFYSEEELSGFVQKYIK
jgi:hypothetical protein